MLGVGALSAPGRCLAMRVPGTVQARPAALAGPPAGVCYHRVVRSEGDGVDLRGFFDRALRSSFRDLNLHDEPAVEYLADLLVRFARTESLYPRGHTVPRLETVVDLLLEAQHAWQDALPRFHPEHELTVRRHLGDYTLFMTGIFPERVERVAGTRYYIAQGKRAYRFVSEHDRASARPSHRAGGPLFGRLSARFESYAGALDYARRVYFREHPSLPFLRVGLG